MAETNAAGGNPLAAIFILLILVAALAGGIVLWGPAVLGLTGVVGTFLMFIALLVVTVS
ncbi:hypothetical protein V5F53_10755 [Xanthobacter sp. V4C-4]|uniref:hypothetical protein n=1 Tax=Xanthobacter cornucopiae TaxID=3119924 RepID=UPI00372A3CEE